EVFSLIKGSRKPGFRALELPYPLDGFTPGTGRALFACSFRCARPFPGADQHIERLKRVLRGHRLGRWIGRNGEENEEDNRHSGTSRVDYVPDVVLRKDDAEGQRFQTDSYNSGDASIPRSCN